MTTTRKAKASEILKAHRAAARVAKARRLDPAFNAQCRAEDAPEPTNPSLGYLAGRYGFQILIFIGLLAFAIWAWPVIVMLVKGAVAMACLIPLMFISDLTRPRRRYYRRIW